MGGRHRLGWAAVLAVAVVLLPCLSSPARAADDGSRPSQIVRLIFLHHSVGENWLADDHGGLGRALAANNYFVSDTNYGWGPNSIGDRTDIPNWLEWFRSSNSQQYLAAMFSETGQHSPYSRPLANPGGPNRVVMFKSCYPNSSLTGGPTDPPAVGTELSVANAKYVYNELLRYFATRPDTLFVVVTAPPNSDGETSANARAFNNWLLTSWRAQNHYPYSNVAVYDFYNVLSGPNNHHRLVSGQEQHVFTPGMNGAYYRSSDGDDHPNVAGSIKARNEFVPMLNAFYHRWRTTPPTGVVRTVRLPALALQDGWVAESASGSRTGRTVNAGGATLAVGDDGGDRAVRSVLSFDTSRLPAGAWITSATVKLRRTAVVGRNPFGSHRNLVMDVRTPFFGSAPSLGGHDFQAPANQGSAAVLNPTPMAGWHTAPLSNQSLKWLNVHGTTQFRLRFQLPSDQDKVADMVTFRSGNAAQVAERPQLEVQYRVG
jgi:hypothetical protein